MLTTVLLKEHQAPHPPGSWWIGANKPRTTFTTTIIYRLLLQSHFDDHESGTSRSAWCCKERGL
eukprot:3912001-Pleurochrysis_carterae.AAC.1